MVSKTPAFFPEGIEDRGASPDRRSIRPSRPSPNLDPKPFADASGEVHPFRRGPCASHPSTSSPQRPVLREVRPASIAASGSTVDVHIPQDRAIVGNLILASPAATWAALRRAYEDLGIPVTESSPGSSPAAKGCTAPSPTTTASRCSSAAPSFRQTTEPPSSTPTSRRGRATPRERATRRCRAPPPGAWSGTSPPGCTSWWPGDSAAPEGRGPRDHSARAPG